MRRLVLAVSMLLVVAACGDTSSADSATTGAPPTEAPVATPAGPTTVAPTTVPVTTSTTTTTTIPAQTYDATVSWDGVTCVYEGPSEVRVGDTVNVTYTNNSADVADYEVDYLLSGSTIEDLDEVTGDFLDRATAVFPDFIKEVAIYPGGRGSQGAGESATDQLIAKVARVHAFTCFGGQASGDQTVDVAEAGFAVTE